MEKVLKNGKILTLEEKLKESMGNRYKTLSKEDRIVIKEMSKCQKMGGAIGTAIIKEEDEY